MENCSPHEILPQQNKIIVLKVSVEKKMEKELSDIVENIKARNDHN